MVGASFSHVSMYVTLLAALPFVSAVMKVTMIGDSITEGGACGTGSYVDILAEMLGSNYKVLNCGVSGMTMMKYGLCGGDTTDGSDCSYWHTDAWQKALVSEPNIVVIMLGTNDVKYFNWEGVQQNIGDYYILDYVDMIKQLRKNGADLKRVFVAVPPPLYDPAPYGMNATVMNQIFPTLIRNLANVTDTDVIDVFSAFSGAFQMCDNCHPNTEGTQVIAEAMYKKIIEVEALYDPQKLVNGLQKINEKTSFRRISSSSLD